MESTQKGGMTNLAQLEETIESFSQKKPEDILIIDVTLDKIKYGMQCIGEYREMIRNKPLEDIDKITEDVLKRLGEYRDRVKNHLTA